MGSIGIKVDYHTAVLSFSNMLNELKLVHVEFSIDNVILAGSTRRESDGLIGDIDIVLVTLDGKIPEGLSSYLNSELGMTIDASGNSLIRAITANGVQFDFYACSEDEIPFMVSYLTGPTSFNIKMRIRAKKLGYKLNQKSLVKADDGSVVLGLVNEESLFKFLGIYEYIKPKDRY